MSAGMTMNDAIRSTLAIFQSEVIAPTCFLVRAFKLSGSESCRNFNDIRVRRSIRAGAISVQNCEPLRRWMPKLAVSRRGV